MATSAHALRVCRLYRSGLKNLMNWTVHRELWIEEGFKLRAQFDANKAVTNARVLEKLLTDGETKLAELTHPDPYLGARPRPFAPSEKRGSPRPAEAPRVNAHPSARQCRPTRAGRSTCAT